MTTYHVYANAAEGYYEAEDEQGARDAFARDAGYKSEADLVAQLEQPSEIVVGAAEPAKAAEIANAIFLGKSAEDLGFAVEDTGGGGTAWKAGTPAGDVWITDKFGETHDFDGEESYMISVCQGDSYDDHIFRADARTGTVEPA